MSYERAGGCSLDYYPCSYEGSRLQFRGPKRQLEEPYIAFLGGTETFGKFITRPFCDRVEDALDVPGINLGVVNGGVEAFVGDLGVLSLVSRAQVCVLQVMSAHHVSNRFYTVHPRRNDRFLRPSDHMKRLFPRTDFTEFHFVGHMLRHLAMVEGDRFMILIEELQTAWVSRMRQLLDRIDAPVVLLWFSDHAPEEKRGFAHVASQPFAVTRAMLGQIESLAEDLVVATASAAALARGNEGMVFASGEAQATLQLLGPSAHDEAARALAARLERYF